MKHRVLIFILLSISIITPVFAIDENLALNTPVLISSSGWYSASPTNLSNFVDGDILTRTTEGDTITSAYIQTDLGAIYNLTDVNMKYHWRKGAIFTAPGNLTLEVSADNISWVSVNYDYRDLSSWNFEGFLNATSVGNYRYIRSTVTRIADGIIYSEWIELTAKTITFNNKTISETQIYQTSQNTKISVKIIDPNNSITSAKVGISLNGTEINYTMTNDNNNNWSYLFVSGTPGTYTIRNFYATDNLGREFNSSWSQLFTVVPTQGQSSAGGGGGGGGGGGQVTATPGTYNISIPTSINIKTLAKDPTGQLILQVMFFVGLYFVFVSLFRANQGSAIVLGGLLIFFSSYGMGWLA